MNRGNHFKQAVCAFLSPSGSCEHLSPLAHATLKDLQALLRWMDDGAIALYLWEKIERLSLLHNLPAVLALELGRRAHDNRARSSRMLSELHSVNQALAATAAPYAFMKGFSLSPQFSIRPELRHQIDIDLLILPDAAPALRATIEELGYLLEYDKHGELKFSTATAKLALRGDYAYDLPPSHQIELHTSFWEPLHRIDLDISSAAALETLEQHQVADVSFPVLALEWRLLLQLLHCYRHFASLWLRIGWLYELAHFIDSQWSDETLFTAFLRLAERFSVEQECGFILRLVSMTFEMHLPFPLQQLADRVPRRAQHWLEYFGTEWALTGFPGSKLPLMVLADLSPRRNSSVYHGLRRMLPTQLAATLAIAPHWRGRRRELLRARLLHTARRSRFHLVATSQYLAQSARWRLLLAWQAHKNKI
ncbi:MAG: nucleotidyltransferase family protein [Acidobacteriaceae bacterium]